MSVSFSVVSRVFCWICLGEKDMVLLSFWTNSYKKHVLRAALTCDVRFTDHQIQFWRHKDSAVGQSSRRSQKMARTKLKHCVEYFHSTLS